YGRSFDWPPGGRGRRRGEQEHGRLGRCGDELFGHAAHRGGPYRGRGGGDEGQDNLRDDRAQGDLRLAQERGGGGVPGNDSAVRPAGVGEGAGHPQ
ncbi:unnamed protein product, partial [Ectocarpus sp. 6 AP-2014]